MPTDPPTAAPHWIDVRAVASLPDGTIAEIRVRGHPLVLVRRGETMHALAGICPHDQARLAGGKIDGPVLVCPRHGARFQLEDGACGPGFSLPALACYPVRVRAGRIEIDSAEVERRPPLPGARERWDLIRR